MPEEFRDCFVGEKGYDALKKLMRNGNDFCTDIAKCLQERSDAETAYARALRKNGDTLQKLAGRAKGTLFTAFTVLGTLISKESEAHSTMANILLTDISIPMKNLAETQYKERKSIEETLNGKFKEWNNAKDIDNKCRSRHFEKSREIEALHLNISSLPKTSRRMARDSTKENIMSTPLVMSCVLPGGRHISASEKMEMTIQKAEEDLGKIEKKYHNSTKNVEIARQLCAVEMCRGCNQMQKMEYERINEMDKFIQTYVNSIRGFTDTMNQVCCDLNSIQVSPNDDIITEARSNLQTTEIEILLYDIYAEYEQAMGEQRRILSLMRWIDMLKKDIEIQRQSNNENLSSLQSAPPQKSVEEASPDDDRDSSGDGAMCSKQSHSKTVSAASYCDGSLSSSSNDDDGAMRRRKNKRREKKNTEGFSSEILIDRSSTRLLQCLYEASLFKIECVYNHIKQLPEKHSEYAHRLTKTYNDKGDPTTLIRIPLQPSTETPPSAPLSIRHFAEAMPMLSQPTMQSSIREYSTQRQAPPIGWTVNDNHMRQTASANNIVPQRYVLQSSKISYPYLKYNQMATTQAGYPVLMTQSTEPYRQKPVKHVRVTHPYKARQTDELTLKKGDIIMLIERREDEWCKGNLDGRIGLFPGTYVEDVE
ncbi:unnamed protein product [Rotaria sordida]|uniref:SH3 domain-containing protein n=1 Tax=Rotaria sordida TaxID=392033 RepID=A0A814VEL7_9BILA|nr:unnamed protein product [Rotaria sordida]